MKVSTHKVSMFETVVERLAKLLTSQWGIKVVFKHNTCKTDGKVITLPTIPANASKQLLAAMHGYLDHEAAHVVFSNFVNHNVNKSAQPKLFAAMNALEDHRIENKWGKVYPGSKVNFQNMKDWLYEKFTIEREVQDPATGTPVMMTPWAQMSNFGKFLVASILYSSNNYNASHDFLQKVVEPKILEDVKKLSHFFKEVLECENTQEVVPLAEKLLEALNELDDPPPPEQEQENEADQQGEPQEGDSDGSGKSKKGKGPPQSGNSPKGRKQEDAEEGDSEEEGEEKEEGDKESKGNSDEESGEEETPKEGQEGESYYGDQSGNDSDLQNAAEYLANDARQELVDGAYAAYTTEGDRYEKMKKMSKTDYHRFLSGVNAMVGTMKNKMARNLLSTTQSRWEGDKTRGKIDSKRLHQVASGGSNRVFRQRLEAPSFDTAVLLMVDHSGSMAGSKLTLAAQTAVVFGEILNQLGVPFSVVGFSTVDDGCIGHHRKGNAPPEAKEVYSRWGDLWLGEYKSFDEPWQFSAPSVLNMPYQSKSNTLDGESLIAGAKILMSRPEKRKVLFWLNDGSPCPNNCDNSGSAVQYTYDAAKEVEKHVELLAIGINTESVQDYYKNWVCVNSLKDLPTVCLGKLDALLQKGRPRL